MKNIRHFLSITDVSKDELLEILKLSQTLKKELKDLGKHQSLPFERKTLVMIFEKPSLRTRISFEIGATQLGGHGIYLAPADIGLGKREEIKDVARVTAEMSDMIMARVFAHKTVVELAKYSKVPVINGLSDTEHPCQTLADLLTMQEAKEKLQGLKVAFLGDSENNVVHSLALASGMLGMHLTTASPKGFWMKPEISKFASSVAKKLGGSIQETTDPKEAVKNADVIYTDTWVSMGDEAEKEQRLKVFKDYQVTPQLMKLAKFDAIFMHDMPAYRGNEVHSDVIDGKQSVIIQQADNRLHAQKGLMVYLLNS